MSTVHRTVLVSLGHAALLVACNGGSGSLPSSNTNTGQGAFSFTGVADETVAPGQKVIVVWSVSSGSPDYSYAFGSGSLEGSQVLVSFSANPPAEALNSGKLGIGLVFVVDANASIPEGKLDSKTFKAGIKAASPQHAIIFRSTTETQLRNGWDTSFPQGFACGQCVKADGGFDSYTAVDCSAVKLVPYTDSIKFCNWT